MMDTIWEDTQESGVSSKADSIIEKNSQAKRDRLAAETREELDKIQRRVDFTIESFEFGEKMMESNIEYVKDVQELMEIVGDTVKKKKYMQQVSVFIVGYENVTEERMKILKQIEEFFQTSCKKVKEEDLVPTDLGVDLDDISASVTSALQTAKSAAQRLNELNKEIIISVNNAALAKQDKKGRKKLEKALQQAKDDIMLLTEKLLGAQAEIEAKEDQMTKLYKQIDSKNIEIDKSRKAADEAKMKLYLVDDYKKKLADKDEELKAFDKKFSEQEFHIKQLEDARDRSYSQMKAVQAEKEEAVGRLEARIINMEKSNEEVVTNYETTINSLKQSHDEQLTNLKSSLQVKIDQLQQQLDTKAFVDTDCVLTPIPLEDEETWASIPDAEMKIRFEQYRRLSMERIGKLETNLKQASSHGTSVEQQFKSRIAEKEKEWELERNKFIIEVDQIRKKLLDAEKEADGAIQQLDEFITQQESLHQVEDYMRAELKHYKLLNVEAQQQFLKSLTPKLRENLLKRLEEESDSGSDSALHLLSAQRKELDDRRASIASRRSTRSCDLDEYDTRARGVLMQHPIVQQFVQTYSCVTDFKHSLSILLDNKQLCGAAELLAAITILDLNDETPIHEQLVNMTNNVISVLGDLILIVVRLLLPEPEFPLDQLPFITNHCSEINQHFSASKSDHLSGRQLKIKLDRMKKEHANKMRELEDQLSQQTSKILEMQQTINSLQRQSEYGSPKPSPTMTETTVMFTRLDSERNSKTMKRAVQSERLSQPEIEDTIGMMDEYTKLPAKRFVQLVKNYTSHVHMKLVEEQLKDSQNEPNLYELMGRLESLRKHKTRAWLFVSDDMSTYRLTIANQLTQQLHQLEDRSGIFLIKPALSYKSRTRHTKFSGKLSNNYRARAVMMTGGPHGPPAPTPARPNVLYPQTLLNRSYTDGVCGSSYGPNKQRIDRHVWSKSASFTDTGACGDITSIMTPRILELDVNRLMIGQNTVSSFIKNQKGDNMIGGPRSYITVARVIPESPNINIVSHPASPFGQKSSQVSLQPKNSEQPVVSESDHTSRSSSKVLPPIVPSKSQDFQSLTQDEMITEQYSTYEQSVLDKAVSVQ